MTLKLIQEDYKPVASKRIQASILFLSLKKGESMPSETELDVQFIYTTSQLVAFMLDSFKKTEEQKHGRFNLS